MFPGHFFRRYGVEDLAALAPVLQVVAVVEQRPFPFGIRPDAVFGPVDGCQVEDREDHVGRILADPLIGQDALLPVVDAQPAEAVGSGAQFVQGGFTRIEMVEGFHPTVDAEMGFVPQHVPIKLRSEVPFVPLAELPAHEEQLCARMGVHVGEHEAEVGKLVLSLSRHPAEQRSFSMDDLVV